MISQQQVIEELTEQINMLEDIEQLKKDNQEMLAIIKKLTNEKDALAN